MKNCVLYYHSCSRTAVVQKHYILCLSNRSENQAIIRQNAHSLLVVFDAFKLKRIVFILSNLLNFLKYNSSHLTHLLVKYTTNDLTTIN